MTQLSYGSVKTYKENGYGFVRSLATSGEVFFHIKAIRYDGISAKIENLCTVSETVSFWYSIEHTGRGDSVTAVWPTLQDVPNDILQPLLSGLVINLVRQIKHLTSVTPGYLRMLREVFSDNRIGDERLDDLLNVPTLLESPDKIVPLLNSARLTKFNKNQEILQEAKQKVATAKALEHRIAAVQTLKLGAVTWEYWTGPDSRLYYIYNRDDRVKWFDCMFLRDTINFFNDDSPEVELLPPLPETWRRIGLVSPIDKPKPLFSGVEPIDSEWLLVYEWRPGAVADSVWQWFLNGQDQLRLETRLEPELYVPAMFLVRMADYVDKPDAGVITRGLPTLAEVQKYTRPLLNALCLEWLLGDSHAAGGEMYALKGAYDELDDEQRKVLQDFVSMFGDALVEPIRHTEREAPTIIRALDEASRRLWQGETLRALPKFMKSETLKALAVFALWDASKSDIAPTAPLLTVDHAYSLLYEYQQSHKKPEDAMTKTIWTDTIEETEKASQPAAANHWYNSFAATPQSESAGRTISTNVVGVTFEGRQRVVATLQSGEQIVLRREPTNPYDHNAIGVETMAGAQIGHINRHLAATLAPELDAIGGVVYGIVSAVTGGYSASSSYGVDIQFTIPAGSGTSYDDDF